METGHEEPEAADEGRRQWRKQTHLPADCAVRLTVCECVVQNAALVGIPVVPLEESLCFCGRERLCHSQRSTQTSSSSSSAPLSQTGLTAHCSSHFSRWSSSFSSDAAFRNLNEGISDDLLFSCRYNSSVVTTRRLYQTWGQISPSPQTLHKHVFNVVSTAKILVLFCKCGTRKNQRTSLHQSSWLSDECNSFSGSFYLWESWHLHAYVRIIAINISERHLMMWVHSKKETSSTILS